MFFTKYAFVNFRCWDALLVRFQAAVDFIWQYMVMETAIAKS